MKVVGPIISSDFDKAHSQHHSRKGANGADELAEVVHLMIRYRQHLSKPDLRRHVFSFDSSYWPAWPYYYSYPVRTLWAYAGNYCVMFAQGNPLGKKSIPFSRLNCVILV